MRVGRQHPIANWLRCDVQLSLERELVKLLLD